MKKYFPLIVILIAFNCKNVVQKDTVVISSNEVKDMVSYLASDDLQGRHVGSAGIDKAAAYIESQFESYGVEPYFETFRDSFEIDSLAAFNVVGFLEGNDDTLKNEFIIIGAHYDHIGFGDDARRKSQKGNITVTDSIANGANDNASGTSAVIAMAKYFATTKSNKRSIIFALFSAEEIGLLGSKHLAKKLKMKGLNLYAMVNFEMIGVPLIDKNYMAFLSGYELSNMAKKLNEYSGMNIIGFSEVSKRNNLFKRSDNFPFYEYFNVPCQTISSCDLSNFDYYHHAEDEVSELDFKFMTDLINNTIPAIEKMANSSTKEISMYESE